MTDNKIMEINDEEIHTSYREMNLPKEIVDNEEEDMVEYLDLELENSMQEAGGYCAKVDRATLPGNKPQSSVLKNNQSTASKSQENSKTKQVLSTEHEASLMRLTSSTEKNPTRRIIKRNKSSRNLETSNARATVDEINAKLACSSNLANNNVSSDSRGTTNSYVLDSSIDVNHSEVKADVDGIDLFFQSMAQTVMTLPPAVQAKIKMDICKVITIAEMRHAVGNATPRS